MMMDVFAEDAPDIAPGEVVHNENGDLSYRIISQVRLTINSVFVF